MSAKEFIRGQAVISEGASEIDGIYFIQDGEFEVTQKLDTDKTKVEQKTAKKALSRTSKVKELENLQSRSKILLSKIDGEVTSVKALGRTSKTLHLLILGKNELFGLDEIAQDQQLRMRTVTCISKTGKCYFIEKSDFVRCANRFKFTQAVINEQMVKNKLYDRRMEQTHEFHQQIIKI